MRISRRKVLVGGASAGALTVIGCDTKPGTDAPDPDPTPVRSPEPDPWDAPGEQDDATFACGVQTGDATDTSVIVSVRTAETGLTLVLVAADGDAWTEVDRREGLDPTHGVLQVTLDELAPDTAYNLAFYTAAGGRSPIARFRTALDGDGWRVVTFGATSCLGGNEPWPSLSNAATEDLDVFLLLGDTIYNDQDPDAYDLETKWTTALSTAGLRELTASTSVIATWDDHEVTNNWSWDTPGMDTLAADALVAFRRGIPQTTGPDGVVWRKLSWGKVLDVFVLDCRSERIDGRYISVEQMEWLKAGLSASAARFKIVMNSVPITDYTPLFGDAEIQDRWSGYPDQRTEILSHIRDNSIAGVLWISGDIHCAQVGRVDPAGGPGEDQWEVLPGPTGSFLNVLAEAFPGDPQYPILFAAWNWARFVCDPGAGTIAVTFVGDDGAVLHEMTLEL